MKFVALLSGGKDSCYNALECVRHGHELVCLANLYPPARVSDEADSFMYQSAGHTAIEAQAECFGKPLIRRELAGHAVNQALQYTPTKMDEVEDLFLLLEEVKARFPEVQAVASGAILSNYQRTRVENVCGRLGLTSLAFLWRRRQSSLLQDMVDSATNAVVVKVASFGLEPSKHLGRSIASLQPFFEGLHKRCGFHVCGEGGEYETLTLDCPLFVRRLVLDETEKVIHSEDMFAPVGLLRVAKCHTEPKDQGLPRGVFLHGGDDADVKDRRGAPGVLRREREGEEARRGGGKDVDRSQQEGDAGRAAGDDTGREGSQEVGQGKGGNKAAGGSQAAAALREVAVGSELRGRRHARFLNVLPHAHEASGGLVYLSGVKAPGPLLSSNAGPFQGDALGGSGASAASAAAARQVERCLASARLALERAGISSMRDVCFVHLYLRDMSHFAAVNVEYCKWFQGENPPSRSCVSAGLSPGCLVMLDLLAVRGSGDALTKEGAACAQRQVLHVRSISSWAPVCIGPYSQANTLGPGNALCLIAGQIGLIPASMVLPPRKDIDATSPSVDEAQAGLESSSRESGSFHGAEMALCVKNASAVASALGASLSRGCVFATLYVSRDAALAAGAAAVAETARIATSHHSADAGTMENGSAVSPLAAPGDGRDAYSGVGKPEDWLEGMVEECRDLIDEGFAEERAEAVAAAAGTGARVEGDEEAEDSAEEGWTSDPEELAKEAERKKVVPRRVPIMPVVVPSLPKSAAVELEVLCVARTAGSLLPCKAYVASTPQTRIPTAPQSYAGSPVPLHLLPQSLLDPAPSSATASKTGEGAVDSNETNILVHREHAGERNAGPVPELDRTCGRFGAGSAAVVSVQTSGSIVDRVLCVVRSSLRIEVDAAPGARSDRRTEGVVLRESAGCRGEHSLTGEEERRRAHPPLSATQFEQALKTLLEKGTSAALSSARLRWQDVSSLRVYYLSPEVTSLDQERPVLPGDLGVDGDSKLGYVDAELVEHAMFLALSAVTPERPAITFIPVEALSSGSRVCVHATAWSLDRLKTELWVRGAS